MISIHALVKRATGITSVNPVTVVISIHALVKRATEYVLRLKHSLIISIHALVKRATCACKRVSKTKRFQSTPS